LHVVGALAVQDLAQQTMVCTWLTEIFLHNINTLTEASSPLHFSAVSLHQSPPPSIYDSYSTSTSMPSASASSPTAASAAAAAAKKDVRSPRCATHDNAVLTFCPVGWGCVLQTRLLRRNGSKPSKHATENCTTSVISWRRIRTVSTGTVHCC